jgi:hypothetical protein
MLTGQQVPATTIGRLIHAVIYMVFFSPFLLIGGGMLLVGVLALGPRKDFAELWICLPAGLALLGFIGYFIYQEFWRVPSLTVTRFAFNGDELELAMRARRMVIRPADVVCEITEQRGVRGRGLLGWWLRLDGSGRVYLDRSTSNAEALIDQLRPIVHEPS